MIVKALQDKTCAHTCEQSCEAACGSKEREINNHSGCLHNCNGGGCLSDIMQHGAENAAHPNMLFIYHLTQQEHTCKAECSSAEAIDERYH